MLTPNKTSNNLYDSIQFLGYLLSTEKLPHNGNSYNTSNHHENPPKLSSTIPMQKELRLEDFFDKVGDTLRSR